MVPDPRAPLDKPTCKYNNDGNDDGNDDGHDDGHDGCVENHIYHDFSFFILYSVGLIFTMTPRARAARQARRFLMFTRTTTRFTRTTTTTSKLYRNPVNVYH
jgi:hypothetical protein